MGKLEGFQKVAVIRYDGGKFHFAVYEDGEDYKPGDFVVLSGKSAPAKIEEIISTEEAAERYHGDICAEVIGKVDVSAYENRVKQRKRKAELEQAMSKRKKEIIKTFNNQFYAYQDEKYAEMLEEYMDIRC